MPSVTTIGTPSAANEKIGGVPNIHYIDFFSKGRGQVVRLLWIDAGIAYTDTRYSSDEFRKDIKPQFQRPGGLNPTGNIPVVELNGKILTQSYAIIRHFSRVLDNQYDGDTEEEKYQVDRLCDIGTDWRTNFINAFIGENAKEEYPKYQKQVRPQFLHGLERHLVENELSQPARGPFVIGKKFTYADMVIFQVLHDDELGKGDQAGLKEYPRLKALYNAVMARPNVKAFFESKDYKG